MAMGFGGPLAWAAFLASVFLLALIAIAATHARFRCIVRPLAAVGLSASGYTLANGVAYLRAWDAGAMYATALGSDAGRSQAENLGALVIPYWPYGAVFVGTAISLAYLVIAWRTRRFIELMTPTPNSDRLARECARVARFDE
ncbi:MAG: hypothetical protein WEC99_07865 [Halofilum sp. (in: g-proteobacteria)]